MTTFAVHMDGGTLKVTDVKVDGPWKRGTICTVVHAENPKRDWYWVIDIFPEGTERHKKEKNSDGARMFNGRATGVTVVGSCFCLNKLNCGCVWKIKK